jgi:hypothetical protein
MENVYFFVLIEVQLLKTVKLMFVVFTNNQSVQQLGYQEQYYLSFGM